MRWNLVGAFVRNNPFGTEIAFRKGLERIGEKVTVVDPSSLMIGDSLGFDQNPDVTVVFKYVEPGRIRDVIASLPGKKVIYQVDDLRFPHIKKMMEEMLPLCPHALTFDTDGANMALTYGYKSAKRLLLTADNVLYRRMPKMPKDIDISFVGSLTNGENHKSRRRMLEIVKEKFPKFNVVVANELFDIGKICEIYNRSKIVLNHATDVGQPFGAGYGYQCRHFEAGFSGACVLSNAVVNDDAITSIEEFNSEESLAWMIGRLLKDSTTDDEPLWRYYGDQLYRELNGSHTPGHRAHEMVRFVQAIE